MRKITLTFLLTIIVILCSSCQTLFPSNKDPISNLRENLTIAQERINNSEINLSQSSERIESSAIDIKNDAIKISRTSDAETTQRLNNIGANANLIINETNILRNIASKLRSAKKNLSEVEDNTNDAVKNSEELQNQITQLEEEKHSALKSAMKYLIIIAILLIAISTVGVFQGNYKAIGGIIGGVVIIVSSLAVSVLYMNLAWIGFVGIVGVILIIAFGIYQGIHNKKEKIKDEKALEETVLTVEALKEKLPEDTKKEFFGERAYPGKSKTIQSKETEEKILNIRRKMKNVISPTIPGK